LNDTQRTAIRVSSDEIDGRATWAGRSADSGDLLNRAAGLHPRSVAADYSAGDLSCIVAVRGMLDFRSRSATSPRNAVDLYDGFELSWRRTGGRIKSERAKSIEWIRLPRRHGSPCRPATSNPGRIVS